jgi:hypothetical protein
LGEVWIDRINLPCLGALQLLLLIIIGTGTGTGAEIATETGFMITDTFFNFIISLLLTTASYFSFLNNYIGLFSHHSNRIKKYKISKLYTITTVNQSYMAQL